MKTFLIWSIQHEAWWRADWRGYTTDLRDAGVYSESEAAAVLKRSNTVAVEECAIPTSCVRDDETQSEAAQHKRVLRAIASLCNAPHWNAERRWKIEALASGREKPVAQ